MANDNILQILLRAIGADAAAAEVAKVETGLRDVGDAADGAAADVSGVGGALGEAAGAATPAADTITDALEGTGIEALGLGDKLAAARAKLDDLRAAGEGATEPATDALGDLGDGAGKAQDALGSLLSEGINALGGPLGIATAAVGLLTAAWQRHRAEMDAAIASARAAADEYRTTREEVEKFREILYGKEAIEPDPVAAGQAAARAESARRRREEIQGRLAALGDADASADDLATAFGGEEALAAALQRAKMAPRVSGMDRYFLGMSQSGIDADASTRVARVPAIRDLLTADLKRQAADARRVEKIATGRASAGREAIGEDGARGVAMQAAYAAAGASRNPGDQEAVKALRDVAATLADGAQGAEMAAAAAELARVAETTGAELRDQIATLRAAVRRLEEQNRNGRSLE